MRRILAVVVFVSLAGGALSAAPKRKKKPGPYGPSSRVERPAEAHGQASLRIRSVDFARRAVVVEVGGFPRAPAGNLFTFIDDRGRRFVAVSATCEAPFPSGVRVCDLITPEGYERHPWTGLELHLHGLSSATVAAPREEVERAYEAGRALAEAEPPEAETVEKQTPAVKAPPPASQEPSSREDGGSKE